MNEIEKAQKKLEIAELRVKATWQRELAAGYTKQASHPIYAGQDIVCGGKAAQVSAIAARTEAKADLLEAQIAEG